MLFEPISEFSSRTIVLPQENVDTDQIIPARFLTTTSREGLGRSVFYDWRFDRHGRPKNSSVFNGLDPDQFQILIAGSNFGCGSSREHAPWALRGYGFRAVISSDIADIFKSNALKNSLLPIEVDQDFYQHLLEHPGIKLTINLENETVGAHRGGMAATFSVEPFARRCLLDGVDPLGHLLKQTPAIEAFERVTG